MAKFCGNCGSPLNSTAVFCGGCGTRVPAAAPPPVPTTSVTAPDPGWAPVPAAFPPPVEAASDLADFSPVPAAWNPPSIPSPATSTPPIEAAPDLAGFSPVPAAWNPPPPIPPPATSTPTNAGYTPVEGAGPTAVPYTQIPAAYAPAQAAYAPAQAAYTPVAATAMPPNAYPAAKKSNALLIVVVAVVLLFFVGGALAIGGLWYAAKKIKAKAQTVASEVMGGAAPSESNGFGSLSGNSSASENGEGGIKGDPCRFLSKAEVSKAVGLPIIRTESQENGCNYIAKGDPADITAKHLSSMLSGMGADAQTQKLAQKFAGGLFAQQEATDKSLSAEAAKGEIPVLALLFTTGHAATEMKMNRRAFDHINGGAPASNETGTDLSGIGDEAYVAGGSMLLLRKGNVLARMTYVSCPCNTDNIKPLAKTLATRL
jgi:hypothetical protein